MLRVLRMSDVASMLKMTIFKLSAIIFIYGGVMGHAVVNFAAAENYSVPLGGTWNIQLHITDPRVDYVYLKREGRNHSENRLIKLNRGESGNGTCYKQAPGCHKYYSLRHIGENVIQITMRLLLKSMEGVYGLYDYCYWADHNCTRDGPIKTFLLIIEDEQNTPQGEKENMTEESPTQVVFTGSAMNIQQSAWLAKLTSVSMVVVPYWVF
ncbi:unnamed protein product [Pocillopora meandrina]|uniref:Uncharacterized protein n=1 Tax=Pocillopora meandrina TaxID=46732 RepID=A0AAU9XNL3_9CNID|nr:unnamed protein product [Pocillopora meandrina]